MVIEVTDVNDNNPMFGLDSVQVNIPESSPVGTRLPEVFRATDDDVGLNARIRYSLLPDEDFMVDAESGTGSYATVCNTRLARHCMILSIVVSRVIPIH